MLRRQNLRKYRIWKLPLVFKTYLVGKDIVFLREKTIARKVLIFLKLCQPFQYQQIFDSKL